MGFMSIVSTIQVQFADLFSRLLVFVNTAVHQIQGVQLNNLKTTLTSLTNAMSIGCFIGKFSSSTNLTSICSYFRLQFKSNSSCGQIFLKFLKNQNKK